MFTSPDTGQQRGAPRALARIGLVQQHIVQQALSG